MSYAKVVGFALLACLALPARARADETLICSRFISVVPFTISVPGHYCFATNIRTRISTGNAITIDADDVLLDLNGFALDGTAAGTGTNANGIFAWDRRHVTVRNGTVRGFFDGLQLGVGGLRAAAITVERMRVDRTAVGIAVRGLGGGHLVRDNVVTNSGGSTVPGETNGVGVSVYGGADVVNNVVTHSFGDSPVAFDVTGGLQTIVNNRVADSGNVGIGCDDPPAGQYLRQRREPDGSPCRRGPPPSVSRSRPRGEGNPSGASHLEYGRHRHPEVGPRADGGHELVRDVLQRQRAKLPESG